MKSGEEFSIESPQALTDGLRQQQNGNTEGYVLKGRVKNPHLASRSLLVSFRECDCSIGANGSRATFYGWADNSQIDERCLSKYCDYALTGTKKSYQGYEFFEKRYEIAEQYCGYLNGAA